MIPAQRIRALVCALFCLAAVAAPAHADDFLKGMQALELGYPEQAIELWRPLAESGSVEAQFGLGVIYNDAMGVEQDYAEANYWFLRAAEQGLPAAQYNLGNAYKNGTGMSPDPKMAVLWWRKAAEQDFAPAQFNLGSALLEGFGVKRDTAAGLEWYRRAAANGHPHAKAYLEKHGGASAPDAAERDTQTQNNVEADTTKPQDDAEDIRLEDAAAQSPGTAAVTPPAIVQQKTATQTEAATPPVAEVAAEPQPSASDARGSSAPAACADWLDRDTNTFTVQLLSSPRPDDAQQYAARHALTDTAICSYQVKGRRWHALLHGRYDSAAAARAALAGLPAPVRADGAYVRRIAEIRAAMSRSR